MSETIPLPEIELLRAKVLHQQLMIEELQAQLLRQQMSVHEGRKTELITKIKDLRDRLANDYNINLDTHVIMQDTGEIVPKDSIPDIKRLMKNLSKSVQGPQLSV